MVSILSLERVYEVMWLIELDTACSWKGCGLLIDCLIKMFTFNFCSLVSVNASENMIFFSHNCWLFLALRKKNH